MQSETLAVTVTPVADAWNTIGTFNVPAGVKRLIRVKFGLVADIAAATTARFVPVYRLMGSGLSEQSPHEYVGGAGGISGIAANSPQLTLDLESYEVDIPVMTGGQFLAQFNMIDEGAIPVVAKCEVAYDNAESVQKNSMSQYTDAVQPVAANTWVAVGNITIPQLKAGDSPIRIREIVMAHGIDIATTGLLIGSLRVRLSGSGIAEGGSHEFIGACQGAGVYAAFGAAYEHGTVRQMVDIPVNPGGTVLVEQLIDSDVPTAGSVAVGLHYE